MCQECEATELGKKLANTVTELLAKAADLESGSGADPVLSGFMHRHGAVRADAKGNPIEPNPQAVASLEQQIAYAKQTYETYHKKFVLQSLANSPDQGGAVFMIACPAIPAPVEEEEKYSQPLLGITENGTIKVIKKESK